MSANKKRSTRTQEIRNSRAFHRYNVGEKFEAGIVLQGTEVKSARLGKAQIAEAFVRIEGPNAILYNAHIDEYAFGNLNNHVPTRPRRLLLHRKQLEQLRHSMEAEGYSLIPIKMYFKGGLIKIAIALCKGKKLYDKREELKKKAHDRDVERAMKDRQRR